VHSVRAGGGYITPLSDPDVETEVRDEMELRGLDRVFARYRAPVHGADGALIGSLLALRDISAEREAERAKDDFFAHVSHELRTPLTSIAGYVELVLSDKRAEL